MVYIRAAHLTHCASSRSNRVQTCLSICTHKHTHTRKRTKTSTSSSHCIAAAAAFSINVVPYIMCKRLKFLATSIKFTQANGHTQRCKQTNKQTYTHTHMLHSLNEYLPVYFTAHSVVYVAFLVFFYLFFVHSVFWLFFMALFLVYFTSVVLVVVRSMVQTSAKSHSYKTAM